MWSIPVPASGNKMTTQEMKLVHRKSMKNEVFDVLHERIIAGQYPAGAWLRQEEISSQLGVSMTPVREALDLLVSAGLTERVPYRGVRVLRPSAEEIADSYGLRLLLESAAVYASALGISCEQLTKLEAILDRSKVLVELKDMSRQRVLNRELHESIVSASGNTLLNKMYVTVLNTFPDWMLYEYMFRHPELLEDSIHHEYMEHRAVVDSLALHDPELAMQATIEHITNRGRELELYLGVPGDLLKAREAHVLPLLGGSRKT
jgi:DNA-binding GntR family transcriptional regulator